MHLFERMHSVVMTSATLCTAGATSKAKALPSRGMGVPPDAHTPM